MKAQERTRMAEREQALVLEAREKGRQYAQRLLRSWQVSLPKMEIHSAVDLALCEAVRCYRPDGPASFCTYVRNYIRGALWDTVNFQRRTVGPHDGQELPNLSGDEEFERPDNDARQTDDQAHYNEFRERFTRAFAELPSVWKQVVVNVDLFGEKVTATAKRLGYSRGHLSEIRRLTHRKLRRELADFQEAA